MPDILNGSLGCGFLGLRHPKSERIPLCLVFDLQAWVGQLVTLEKLSDMVEDLGGLEEQLRTLSTPSTDILSMHSATFTIFVAVGTGGRVTYLGVKYVSYLGHKRLGNTAMLGNGIIAPWAPFLILKQDFDHLPFISIGASNSMSRRRTRTLCGVFHVEAAISRTSAIKILDEFARPARNDSETVHPHEQLSTRELEMLTLLTKGTISGMPGSVGKPGLTPRSPDVSGPPGSSPVPVHRHVPPAKGAPWWWGHHPSRD